jgi:hypothetical protein
VNHKPEIVLYSNCDAFADAPHFAHDTTFHTRDWWLCGSQQKSARQPHALERLSDDAWFKSANVGSDIRQFRHAYQLACPSRSLQPCILMT